MYAESLRVFADVSVKDGRDPPNAPLKYGRLLGVEESSSSPLRGRFSDEGTQLKQCMQHDRLRQSCALQ